MDGNFNLEQWVLNSVGETKADGVTRDFHISEIVNYKSYKPKRRFISALSIFNDVIRHLSKVNTEGISVYMSIDLVSNSISMVGAPISVQDVEASIDPYSVPEIIIYKPYEPEIIPLVELYRTPLVFSLFNFEGPVQIFYKEFRTFQGLINNETFTRELNVVYYPDYSSLNAEA